MSDAPQNSASSTGGCPYKPSNRNVETAATKSYTVHFEPALSRNIYQKTISLIKEICSRLSPSKILSKRYLFSLSIWLFVFAGLNAEEYVHALVNIKEEIPGITIDLKYATEDNFTGQIVYDFQECLLIKQAALLLKEVQAELELMGLGLKVWDGFRSLSAQWKFWELVPDTRYVSDPRKGGRHTRGTAVDLTLTGQDGSELPMPSKFDDFSEKAHRDYVDCSLEERKNRELLEFVMEKHGFIGLQTEWWHFDMIGWEDYPPIDFVPNVASKDRNRFFHPLKRQSY